MAFKLVGTIGAVNDTAIDVSNTTVWGTGEARTAGNLLLCSVAQSGTAISLPPTPTGWNVAAQVAATIDVSETIFYKLATGGDAAPSFSATSNVRWATQLAEFTTNVGAPALDHTGTATGTTSPLVVTATGTDRAIGDLMVTVASSWSTTSHTVTCSDTYNNGSAITTTNAVNAQYHYDFSYAITTTNATADSDSLTISNTANLAAAALIQASFKIVGSNFLGIL